jgi:hypothetical protein
MKNEQSLVSITNQHRYVQKSSKLMKQKAVKYIFGQGICCEFNNQKDCEKTVQLLFMTCEILLWTFIV